MKTNIGIFEVRESKLQQRKLRWLRMKHPKAWIRRVTYERRL